MERITHDEVKLSYNSTERNTVMKELYIQAMEDMIMERTENYVSQGMDENEAEEKAVKGQSTSSGEIARGPNIQR